MANTKSKKIKTSNYIIKQISASETHSVRHPVLRAGKSIESCIFEGDTLKSTIHLGLFMDNNLVGISSFLKNSNPGIPETSQYQLRGMAVLKSFQGKGLGQIILKHGESLLKEKNAKVLWCNAREVAINFYKKNGYQIIGKSFNLKGIGLHYKMYKTL